MCYRSRIPVKDRAPGRKEKKRLCPAAGKREKKGIASMGNILLAHRLFCLTGLGLVRQCFEAPSLEALSDIPACQVLLNV